MFYAGEHRKTDIQMLPNSLSICYVVDTNLIVIPGPNTKCKRQDQVCGET